jgi:hypothetical protein
MLLIKINLKMSRLKVELEKAFKTNYGGGED